MDQVAPVVTADQWLADPQAALTTIDQFAQNEWGSLPILAAALGVAAVGLRFLRHTGPFGESLAWLGQWALDSVFPQQARSRSDQSLMSDVAFTIMAAIEDAPADASIKDLKRSINENTPAEFNKIHNEWVTRRRKG